MRSWLFGVLGLSILVAGCGDVTDPHDDHEHEAITNVVLRVANTTDASDTATVQFTDADGEGGKAPVLPMALTLRSGSVYTASVTFMDASNPADVHNLNEEIGGSESDDHQVFWVSLKQVVTPIVTDRDSTGLPLGLKASITTSATGSDSLRVVLRHLPGIKTATSTITSGETDADIVFPITIVTRAP